MQQQQEQERKRQASHAGLVRAVNEVRDYENSLPGPAPVSAWL